jgi:hypothetical protein
MVAVVLGYTLKLDKSKRGECRMALASGKSTSLLTIHAVAVPLVVELLVELDPFDPMFGQLCLVLWWSIVSPWS